MGKVVGLAFGTTNSAIAVATPDGEAALATFSEDGQRTATFRSVLYFDAENLSMFESWIDLDLQAIANCVDRLLTRCGVSPSDMEARGTPDGERKTITALFADVKGSTALIEDLDPEDARAIIDPALAFMMEAVHRYEGYVAQSLGDGIFALFGAPIAHEDHAQRALHAALRMQEESRRYAERLRRERGLNFYIRVGINTGEVAGELSSRVPA